MSPLGPTQVLALCAIDEHHERGWFPTTSQVGRYIAEMMLLTGKASSLHDETSAAQGALQRLERRGLVGRNQPDVGRPLGWYLTDAGGEALVALGKGPAQ